MRIPVLLYLLFNTLAFWMGKDMRWAQEFFFQTSSLFLILSPILFDSPKIKNKGYELKFNIALGAFFVWTIFTYLRFMEGWSIAYNIFLGIGVYYTVARSLAYNDVKFVIKGAMWLVVFAIGYLILQFFGIDIRGQFVRGPHTDIIPLCSIFGLQALYGLFLAMMFPLYLGVSKINEWEINGSIWGVIRAILIVLGVLGMLAALYPSNSTAAFAGFIAAALFYLWHRIRIVFWACLIPIILGGYLYVSLYDNPMGMQKTRFGMWIKVIQDVHQKPFGRGLDSFRNDNKEGAVKYLKLVAENKKIDNTTVRAIKKDDQWFVEGILPPESVERSKQGLNPLNFWSEAHNDYIQVFYEMGYPAIIIIGFMFYYLWRIFDFCRKRALETAAFSALISIAIFTNLQFPFHVSRIAHIIPVILGMFIVTARDEC